MILMFLFWVRRRFLNCHQCGVILPVCFLKQKALDVKRAGHTSEFKYAEPYPLACEQRLNLERLYHTCVFWEEVLLEPLHVQSEVSLQGLD